MGILPVNALLSCNDRCKKVNCEAFVLRLHFKLLSLDISLNVIESDSNTFCTYTLVLLSHVLF